MPDIGVGEGGSDGLVAVRGLAPASLSGFAVGYVDADGRERRDGLVEAADPVTFYGGDRTGCADYPTLDAAQK